MDITDQSVNRPVSGPFAAKSKPWWAKPSGIIAIVFLSIFLMFVLMGVVTVIKIAQSGGGKGPIAKGFDEEFISGSGKTKVVRISISGVIVERSRSLFYDGAVTADRVIEELKTAGEDSNVGAVLLRIDSPGGGITASDRVYREIEKLRQKKLVVALMGDTAASGAYYISVAANRIFAHPTTVTGSIGVIVNTINVHDLMKQIGVQAVTIKSGNYKDLLSSFKPMEDLEKDKAVYQQIVTKLYDRFVMLVSKGRNLPIDKVRELADGRIYDAQTALDTKLVDQIGYQDDVLDWIKKKLGNRPLKFIEYTRRRGLISRMFLEDDEAELARVSITDILSWIELRSRPMYLWLPGI